jgi:hypothetical protein
MAVVAIPTLTLVTYVAIILLFVLSALYVGFQFEPLPAEEIGAVVEEVEGDD